jgi:glycosyltransferase involved in cell wall biosynthesis
MPLVSVVIPTHNRADMLAQTLAKVAAQTFTDYEIIVISNGEGPESRGRSQAVATLNNAWWFALDEGNVSAARNLGISRAAGEWVAFLDDDDLWLRHKLERQLAEADRTGADMISCDYIEFYADGRELLRQPRLPDGWSHLRAIHHLLWWAPPSGVIVRRSVLAEVGGFDAKQRYSEDNDLWRQIALRHRICSVEEVLFRYRQGHASMMQHERLRYFYDLRFYFKSWFDTPHELRSTLATSSFFWRRVAIICFPGWLTRQLELTSWGGPFWFALFPLQFREWLRPRRRWIAFKQKLRPRSR